MPNKTNHYLHLTSVGLAFMFLAAACGGATQSDGAALDAPSAAVPSESEADSGQGATTQRSGDGGGESVVEQPGLATEAPPDLSFLDPAVQDLVEFEAAWQCDLARFAVEELSAIDSLLAERRAEFGVTDDGYVEFQERLAVDPELRELVAEQTSSCIEVGESVQL